MSGKDIQPTMHLDPHPTVQFMLEMVSKTPTFVSQSELIFFETLLKNMIKTNYSKKKQIKPNFLIFFF